MRKSNKNIRKRQNRKIKTRKINKKTIRKSRKKSRKARKLYIKGGQGNNASGNSITDNKYYDQLIEKINDFIQNIPQTAEIINTKKYSEQIQIYFENNQEVKQIETNKDKKYNIRVTKKDVNKFLNSINDEALIKELLNLNPIIIIAILDGYKIFSPEKMLRGNTYLKRYFKYSAILSGKMDKISNIFDNIYNKFCTLNNTNTLKMFYELIIKKVNLDQNKYKEKLEELEEKFTTISSIQGLIDLEKELKKFVVEKINSTKNLQYKDIKLEDLFSFINKLFIENSKDIISKKEEKSRVLKEALLSLLYDYGILKVINKYEQLGQKGFGFYTNLIQQKILFKNDFYESEHLQDIKTKLEPIILQRLKNCCIQQSKPSKNTVNFYFIRHGQSEHNVRNSMTTYMSEKDPLLSELGILTGLKKGKEAKHDKKINPDLILSSPLLRSIQTAYYMFIYDNIDIENKKIHIVPYVCEIDPTLPNKIMETNHPEAIEQQDIILENHFEKKRITKDKRPEIIRDTKAYTPQNYNKKNSFSKFINWFFNESNFRMNIYNGLNVVVVTHSNLMKREFGLQEKPKNNAIIHIPISYENGKVMEITQKYLKNMEKKFVLKGMDENEFK